MVNIRSITIPPPLVNTACAWASDERQLAALLDCPYTGAVTTRTATLAGFSEDTSHTVAFLDNGLSSLNSYGYSPHTLHTYVGPNGWLRTLLARTPNSSKPFIISITSSHPADLSTMLDSIQDLRTAQPGWSTRIAIELNTSCPNIPTRPPPSYDSDLAVSLGPLLDTLAEHFWADTSLVIGIKLPPYVVASQISGVVQTLGTYSRADSVSGTLVNPFAFLTCTNTLGSCLAFEDQVHNGANGDAFAVPPGVGGLAGEAIHTLSLGNVHAFSKLLAKSDDPALQQIVIIGAGGVTSPEAVTRMHRAGAEVVGCATLLGKMGVAAFEHLAAQRPNVPPLDQGSSRSKQKDPQPLTGRSPPHAGLTWACRFWEDPFFLELTKFADCPEVLATLPTDTDVWDCHGIYDHAPLATFAVLKEGATYWFALAEDYSIIRILLRDEDEEPEFCEHTFDYDYTPQKPAPVWTLR